MFFLRADQRPRHGADKGDAHPDPADAGEVRKEQAPDDFIYCRRCGHPVTRRRFAATVNGSHHHTFANPHGIVFEIGCFRAAAGVLHAGAPSAEWSWFAGYHWRVAACASCQVHLGWLFTAGKQAQSLFYGLILDYLQE